MTDSHSQPDTVQSFQARVVPWMLECFGPTIPFDRTERNHRFLEEALELVQACGCTQDEAHQLVDYVYSRDQGDINQEVGGVMVTLAALCFANDFDMHGAGETELARIWTKIEQIRTKQAAKPKHSPLPARATPAQPAGMREKIARIQQLECAIREAYEHWSNTNFVRKVLRAALKPEPAGAAQCAPDPDQAWRDSDWLGLSASEKACYYWPEDTDLHRQCRAAYVAGALLLSSHQENTP